MQETFENIIEKLEGQIRIEENIAKKESDGHPITHQYAANCMKVIEKSVKQEAEQYNNGWIPCSERLPENNNVVLCWVVSKTIASGETFIIGSCDRGFWFLQTYEIGHHHFPVKDYEVVAWMPLPQPYQTKGE